MQVILEVQKAYLYIIICVFFSMHRVGPRNELYSFDFDYSKVQKVYVYNVQIWSMYGMWTLSPDNEQVLIAVFSHFKAT